MAMRVALPIIRLLLAALRTQLSGGRQPVRQLSAKVRRIKERRLEELEAQAAAYGPATPPEITNEIKDLRNELELVDSLERSTLDPPLQELLGRYDTTDQILAFFRAQAGRVRQLEDAIGELGDEFHRWIGMRQQQAAQDAIDRARFSWILGVIMAITVLNAIGLLLLFIVGLTR